MKYDFGQFTQYAIDADLSGEEFTTDLGLLYVLDDG